MQPPQIQNLMSIGMELNGPNKPKDLCPSRSWEAKTSSLHFVLQVNVISARFQIIVNTIDSKTKNSHIMVALGLVNGKEKLYFFLRSTIMWIGKITYVAGAI